MKSQYLVRGNHLAPLRKCCAMHEWVVQFGSCYSLVAPGFTSSMVGLHPGRICSLRSRGLVRCVPGYNHPLRYVALPVSLEWYHRGE